LASCVSVCQCQGFLSRTAVSCRATCFGT
jgi:hypothetical protein